MRARTALVAAALALLTAPLGVPASAGAQGRPDDPGSPAAYWTAERRAAAIPRDLVLDERGLGYLRRPDGSFQPYGHDVPAAATQLRAVRTATPIPAAKPGGGGSTDTTPPQISSLDPNGTTIGASYDFRAEVTDQSGVRSVSFVVVYPDGRTQSFAAGLIGGSTYGLTIQGFTDGAWSWRVVAKDLAGRNGNTATSSTALFTVDTGTGGGGDPGDGVVTNAGWTGGGAIQTAAGRIYFEMPANRRMTRWTGYVCSGTTVDDGTHAGSVIITAAHCVYDDVNGTFARNVLFIPDQDGTTGSSTDRDCTNDPHGCWSPSFGVVDADWASRTWPSNIPWDYAFYVATDASHSGNGSGGPLDGLATLPVSFTAPTVGTTTAALGYSYSDDPNFMYCQEPLGEDGADDWFLPSCGLSGGASGGPWIQPVDGDAGPIVSVNSYGYTNEPGMGGPHLSGSSALCVFDLAKSTALSTTGGVQGC